MNKNYLLFKKRFGNLKTSSYISFVIINKHLKLKTMATKNQTMELARNVIAELDKEIKTAKSIIEMIKSSEEYTGELEEILLQDWDTHLKTLVRLRDFVIYQA
jgi:hypothetical protein